MVTLDVNRTGV